MPMRLSLSRLLALLLLGALTAAQAHADLDERTATLLRSAIDGEHRSADNRARDQYRRPYETLEFLGLRSDMTVVELWPGGGWYSEILAPVLKDDGVFYAAHFTTNAPYGYQRRGLGAFLSKLGAKPDLYGNVVVTEFELPYHLRAAPAGSADMVLTFRNVHNLVMDIYGGGAYAELTMTALYDALKPGGILGVVDHAWDDPATEDPRAGNGYISRQRTITLAEAAGFQLVGESDLLANPRDTKDYAEGVWTLPPSFALGDQDRERYAAIGESDRFLLKFVKPE